MEIVRIRLEATSQQALAKASELLRQQVGDDRIGGLELPTGPARKGGYLAYGFLEVADRNRANSEEKP